MMEKNYNHLAHEDKIYKTWEEKNVMKADENSQRKAFTIPVPPPNVTGQLHLGHAAMLAIEDILIRFKKMTNHEVLWIPGTDHAAIATENVVLKHLNLKSREKIIPKKGLSARKSFLQECRKFANEKHDTIVGQMKKMGAHLDWSREAYTFDKPRNLAVNTIFKQLFDDGLISRGHRMINWSSGAQSVISDDELEWQEEQEPFYYIRCGKFVISTVRPETKCANSPLVVNPEGKYVEAIFTDKNGKSETLIFAKNLYENKKELNRVFNFLDKNGQWKIAKEFSGGELVGEKFKYETYAGSREFTVIADNIIDINKGTGAMTISSCHSADDYELAQRLKLKETFIEKIDFEGKMTATAGEAAGMSVKKAREFAGKKMQEMNLLVGIDKDYIHRVPVCYRSGCVVEPMVSPQWFILVEKEFTDKFTGKKTTLKKLTQDAVRENHVKIIPERFNKIYFQWIDNLRDWCISRQIWWGHRIPVWYCEDCGKENVFVNVDENSSCQKQTQHKNLHCEKCKSKNLRQDEDTLDTWFSSALWPFSILGWPNVDDQNLAKFYPNDVLETGHDILFFWVARMIMFGRYATGKYPFHTTYLHGLVCDEKGKKMSKSKGNGIDPLEMISEFGADPVRLALIIGSTPGNNIPIGKAKIAGYRNFVNKLWNAGRFIEMKTNKNSRENLITNTTINLVPTNLAEKWIASKFNNLVSEVKNHLEKYELSSAGEKIYQFVWNDFCDWFLEASKIQNNEEFLIGIFREILCLIQPFCPFITQAIWSSLFGEKAGLIVEQSFPEINFNDKKSHEIFTNIQNIVTEIRRIRAEKKLNPKEKLEIEINANSQEISPEFLEITKILANLSNIKINEKNLIETENSILCLVDNFEILINIPINEEEKISRKKQELDALNKQIQLLETRLANDKYVKNAPEKLVKESREILEKAKKEKEMLEL